MFGTSISKVVVRRSWVAKISSILKYFSSKLSYFDKSVKTDISENTKNLN